MGHAFFDINRIEMSGRARSLSAATLVDRNVDQDAAGLHLFQHRPRNQFWRLCPWEEDRTDQQIDIGHQLLEMRFAGIESVRAAHGDIEKAHPFEVDLENSRSEERR